MLFQYFLPFLFLTPALSAPAKSPSKNLDLIGKPKGGKIAGKYIVVLKDDANVDSLLGGLTQSIFGGIQHTFKHAIKGFAGSLSQAELVLLRANPAVKYVEQDAEAFIVDEQAGAPYGLAITSQNGPIAPENQNTYYYKQPAAGVPTVYILDTGIDTSHPEFGGRATFATDLTGEGAFDGNGHGTHVAGTVGSNSYGVFKQANLAAVKVFDSSGSGSLSTVIAALDYVRNNAAGPSVINMSLSANGVVQSVNDAVRATHDAGITVVVSAGNSGQSGIGACSLSPASEPTAITVGAIDSAYTTAYFSSEDSCVDVHAAGVGVLSTWPGGATNVLDGTSMSSPHIAGLAAYFIAQFGSSNPNDVLNSINQYAENGILNGNLNGAPNVLGNNGFYKY